MHPPVCIGSGPVGATCRCRHFPWASFARPDGGGHLQWVSSPLCCLRVVSSAEMTPPSSAFTSSGKVSQSPWASQLLHHRIRYSLGGAVPDVRTCHCVSCPFQQMQTDPRLTDSSITRDPAPGPALLRVLSTCRPQGSLLGSPKASRQLRARKQVGCEPPCCPRSPGRKVSISEAGTEPGSVLPGQVP